ncbi:hypothetical protein V2J09_015924 [Rumex salicifolius]
MELALSLGDPSKPFSFLEKKQNKSGESTAAAATANFGSTCMGLGLDLGGRSANQAKRERRRDELDDDGDDEKEEEEEEEEEEDEGEKHGATSSSSSDHHPLQLELLPFSPVPRPHQIPSQIRFPWLPSSDILSCEAGSSEMKRLPAPRATSVEEQSSPNSAGSSFMEFSLYRRGGAAGSSFSGGKRFCSDRGAGTEAEPPTERAASRGSDDDENGSTRKKLRLSKEQSAFLEESFKEHHTLNPKQKIALAKQLNLRPRQVEVWFQNRRARTKLKQTEVDCEYLKRCCETLTEENRRLQKELQELRALKTSQPFYMQLPATTLTMCPSCERVTPTTSAAAASSVVKPPGNPPTTTITRPVAPAVGNNPKPMLPFGGPQAQSQAHKEDRKRGCGKVIRKCYHQKSAFLDF